MRSLFAQIHLALIFCLMEGSCFCICFCKHLDLNISHISIANGLKQE